MMSNFSLRQKLCKKIKKVLKEHEKNYISKKKRNNKKWRGKEEKCKNEKNKKNFGRKREV